MTTSSDAPSRLLALDLDGTLEDSRADMVASVNRVRARFSASERSYDDVVPHVGRGMTALYLACFDDVLAGAPAGSARFHEVRRAYEQDYLEHVAVHTRLYDGIAAALGELSALGGLVVVTNKPEHISRRLLAALSVQDRIEHVIGGDTLPVEKPDPRLLTAAQERLLEGEQRHESLRAVMIGDSAGDVRMGRAFGAVTVWCAWGYVREPPEGPDYVAEQPRDLAKIVRSLAG